MDLQQRINAFVRLGSFLDRLSDKESPEFKKFQFDTILQLSYQTNGWFTEENVLKMVAAIADSLNKDDMQKWLSADSAKINSHSPKTIAVIMAGNIPLVGFHDLLCVLITGNKALVKMSSDDNILMPFVIRALVETEPEFEDQITFSDNKMQNFDAVIATGSNNTARYFNYYFGKYPHIIRKNRNSLAVLSGNESKEELKALGDDIFTYFGLGCRSVSKLYVPEAYNFDALFEAIFPFGDIINNKKYGNNYDYNRTIFLMNSDKFLDNNFVMIRENADLSGPVGMLNYETYSDLKVLVATLKIRKNEIQCISTNLELGIPTVKLGTAQHPKLWDYADGINTLEFLLSL